MLYFRTLQTKWMSLAHATLLIALLGGCGEADNGQSNINAVHSPVTNALSTVPPLIESEKPVTQAEAPLPEVSIEALPTTAATNDQPFHDTVRYPLGAEDSVTDTNEQAAVTHHQIALNGQVFDYTAKAGHLVTSDPASSQPNAKIFYTAFTADKQTPATRSVTFVYNGQQGSPVMWSFILGSFAPKRAKISMPDFKPPAYVPPARYTLEDNPQSLLDQTDLVFIYPVGTAYSAAIAPRKNEDFLNTDRDADTIAQFIQRYLSLNQREQSPKFLIGGFGYGAAAQAIVSHQLQKAGIPLNGIAFFSPELDYRLPTFEHLIAVPPKPVTLLPTLAANAWYHNPQEKFSNKNLYEHLEEVKQFATSDYRTAVGVGNTFWNAIDEAVYYNADPVLSVKLKAIRKRLGSPTYQDHINELKKGDQAEVALALKIETLFTSLGTPSLDEAIVQKLSHYLGVDPALPTANIHNLLQGNSNWFLKGGLSPSGNLGQYDGRKIGIINTSITPGNLHNYSDPDPAAMAVNRAYKTAWHGYVIRGLKYTNVSQWVRDTWLDTDQWDYRHIDPIGTETRVLSDLNATVDLAETIKLNPNIAVFYANGMYDSVTPFYKSFRDFELMKKQLLPNQRVNITKRKYFAGHMIYLDDAARIALRADLRAFYDKASQR
jgi:carboxypeptidase C (cathepsin A)